ncbi:LLM class flavin-dependent oxidoreductase [Gordonia sp. NPDC003376]
MTPIPLLLADIHHSGDHEGAWRLPTSPIGRIDDPTYYLEFARTVQTGGFDGIFFADFIGFDPLVASVIRWPFEPTTLAAAILQEVPDLNVVVTSSTVFATPDQLYRTFRSLHALSQGRIGWNIVTTGSPATAKAFGDITVPGHAERYEAADGIVAGLRGRWGDDRPLLVQAGASEPGRAFAARHADVVFGATPTKEAARAFRTDLRRRAADAGRDPDEIRFLPGILTTLGATAEQASALRDTLDGLVTEDAARHMLRMYGITVPQGAFDDPVGELRLDPGHNGILSRAGVLGEIVEQIGTSATWRQLVAAIAGSRGHLSVTGTGPDVAAVMNDWLDDEACDGFIVKFAHSPGGVADYVASVTPHLRARGIGRRAGWPTVTHV